MCERWAGQGPPHTVGVTWDGRTAVGMHTSLRVGASPTLSYPHPTHRPSVDGAGLPSKGPGRLVRVPAAPPGILLAPCPCGCSCLAPGTSLPAARRAAPSCESRPRSVPSPGGTSARPPSRLGSSSSFRDMSPKESSEHSVAVTCTRTPWSKAQQASRPARQQREGKAGLWSESMGGS